MLVCRGCVLGLVVLPLISVSGSLFDANVVRLGSVLLVLVLVVVGSVCGTGASSGYCSALIASVGQSFRVRNLLCAMQMRVVRVTSSDVQFALA